jgi:hypothetical protein
MCENPVFNNKINIGIYNLAVLPIDYLVRLGCPFEQLCEDQNIDPDYREVFTIGIRSYQLVTYLKLVREHYGRGIANQINSYQQRLLDKEPGGKPVNHAIRLINRALASDAVAADTDHGRIDIPIEMNVALSLLLIVPSSPHCVSHPNECAAEIGTMGLDIDWLLSQCLTRARDDTQKVFAPLLACIDSGVHIDYVQSYISEKLVAN